jgi:uncharacterized protein DUF3108
MQRIITSFIILLSTVIQFAHGQSKCSKYYPLEEGTAFQYTSYNKKDKADGVTDYKITKVANSNGQTTATMELRLTDKKGKEVYSSNYNFTCTGTGIKIDYKSLFPSQMMKQYEDMGLEMDITGTDIELPNNLSVGQDLADANVAISMNMGAMKMNIKVDMTNRKVEKKEKVTTPAGTFDCFLITETNTSKTMGATHEMQSKLWLTEGVGMIKQELYKKNGGLMSRSVLTKLNK